MDAQARATLEIDGTLEYADLAAGDPGRRRYLVVISGRSYYLGRRLFSALLSIAAAGGKAALPTRAREHFAEGAASIDASPADLARLEHAGLVRDASRPRAARPPSGAKAWVSLQFTLLPARIVNLLARPGSVLFSNACVLVLAPLVVLAMVTCCIVMPDVVIRPYIFISELYRNLTLPTVVVISLLLLLSSLAHELGHASALRHFGLAPGRVGCGIYVMFPVFFSELNRAWVLSGKQRALVSAGGLYVQGIVVLVINAVIWAAFGPAWKLTLEVVDVSYLLTTFANLNPFLKFDGYWILADLLGIPGLASRANRLTLGVLARVRDWCRAPQYNPRRPLEPATRAEWWYTAVRPIALAAYFGYIAYVSVGSTMQALQVGADTWRRLLAGHPPDVEFVLQTAYGLLLTGLIVAGLIISLNRLASLVGRYLGRRVTTDER